MTGFFVSDGMRCDANQSFIGFTTYEHTIRQIDFCFIGWQNVNKNFVYYRITHAVRLCG